MAWIYFGYFIHHNVKKSSVLISDQFFFLQVTPLFELILSICSNINWKWLNGQVYVAADGSNQLKKWCYLKKKKNRSEISTEYVLTLWWIKYPKYIQGNLMNENNNKNDATAWWCLMMPTAEGRIAPNTRKLYMQLRHAEICWNSPRRTVHRSRLRIHAARPLMFCTDYISIILSNTQKFKNNKYKTGPHLYLGIFETVKYDIKVRYAIKGFIYSRREIYFRANFYH